MARISGVLNVFIDLTKPLAFPLHAWHHGKVCKSAACHQAPQQAKLQGPWWEQQQVNSRELSGCGTLMICQKSVPWCESEVTWLIVWPTNQKSTRFLQCSAAAHCATWHKDLTKKHSSCLGCLPDAILVDNILMPCNQSQLSCVSGTLQLVDSCLG